MLHLRKSRLSNFYVVRNRTGELPYIPPIGFGVLGSENNYGRSVAMGRHTNTSFRCFLFEVIANG